MLNQPLNGISPQAVTPQINYVDVVQQLEQALNTDAQRLQLLIQQGVITQQQGLYLMNNLAETQKKLDLCKQSIPMAQDVELSVQDSQQPFLNPLELFSQENPGFFDKDGRSDLLDYLKNLDVDKDEISKIAKLVEKLETSAVEGYLKKSAHEKSLNDENSAAKSKLTSYAQNAVNDSNNNRIFTREEIGKMSGDEFAKNEKLIMEQVRQGFIK